MRKNNHSVNQLVIFALLSAITILLAAIPNVGFITLGPLSLTILHIPVLIAGLLYGVKGGLFLGTLFGVSSWLVSMSRGGLTDALFMNPVVSVVPRMMFGLFVGVLATVLVLKSTTKSSWKYAVVSFASSLFHTLMVLLFVFSVSFEGGFSIMSFIGQFWMFMIPFLIQGLAEALLASFIVVAVLKALNR